MVNVIDISLNKNCNADCSYCEDIKDKSLVVSEEDLNNVISNLEKVNNANVVVLGGEITTTPDTLSSFLNKIEGLMNKNIARIYFYTNGKVFNEELNEFCKRHLNAYTVVSSDTLISSTERNIPLDILKRNIESYSNCILATTITANNIDELIESAKIAKQLGVIGMKYKFERYYAMNIREGSSDYQGVVKDRLEEIFSEVSEMNMALLTSAHFIPVFTKINENIKEKNFNVMYDYTLVKDWNHTFIRKSILNEVSNAQELFNDFYVLSEAL